MFFSSLLYFVLEALPLAFTKGSVVDPAQSQIWGPGLFPDRIVMPARYFYIQAVDMHKHA
jgi:hypothetical protein